MEGIRLRDLGYCGLRFRGLGFRGSGLKFRVWRRAVGHALGLLRV